MSSPSAPPIVYQPAPKKTDPAVEAAREKERLLARRRRGRQSTILAEAATSESDGQSILLGG